MGLWVLVAKHITVAIDRFLREVFGLRKLQLIQQHAAEIVHRGQRSGMVVAKQQTGSSQRFTLIGLSLRRSLLVAKQHRDAVQDVESEAGDINPSGTLSRQCVYKARLSLVEPTLQTQHCT